MGRRIMKFDYLTLGDHLPDPRTGRYNETQAERCRMWVDLGVHAETLGFSGVFFGEHHGSDYILSSPQMLLAAVAVQTRSVRLGTAISLLPTNDPVRIAEDFATLDLLSGGRAEIGFGAGITEHTFRLFGQDVEHSAEIAAEHLELVQRLWNERQVTWRGRRRAPVERFELQPRTASLRAIPISLATATSIATAEQAGRAGHKLMVMTIVGSFAGARPLAEAYRRAYRAAGHDPGGMCVTAVAYVHVQADDARAREYWAPYLRKYREFVGQLAARMVPTKGVRAVAAANPGLDPLASREADFVGDPARIIDQISKANEDAGGFDRLLCYFDVGGLSRADTLASMNLFADKVMRAFG
jgi:alkanesulfonate monooxygenase SsuD/methylene tetrahydromethanopterin reductase-like flavin-dependent oxidoreductase (luciferase family)